MTVCSSSSAPSPAIASTRRPSDTGSAIATTRASISSRSLSTTSCSCLREVELADESFADLLHRLELPRPRGRGFVQPRIFDRHRRLRREERDELLVMLVELGAAGLFRQIEIPVRNASEHDRRAEERLHLRMTRREADGPRIVRDRVQPQRARVGDQRAEDAAAAGQVTDAPARLVVDAVRDEPFERRPGRIDHPESRVLRGGDECGGLDDALRALRRGRAPS